MTYVLRIDGRELRFLQRVVLDYRWHDGIYSRTCC